MHGRDAAGEATKFTHETGRAAAKSKKSVAAIDDPAKRARRAAKDMAGVHKKVRCGAAGRLVRVHAVEGASRLNREEEQAGTPERSRGWDSADRIVGLRGGEGRWWDLRGPCRTPDSVSGWTAALARRMVVARKDDRERGARGRARGRWAYATQGAARAGNC